MLISIAMMFLVGMSMGWICKKIHLPSLFGMIVTGIVLGPYVLDVIDASILNISSDLRRIALIIILMRAGLSLDLNDLKKVGRPAVLMCFVPACFEIGGMILLAPKLLGISILDAAIMGTVIAAVSPAVIVPKMLKLMEEGYGVKKSIPQMILAGASVDDVFVIVMFTAFTGLAQGDQVSAVDFINIPISIAVGALAGFLIGFLSAEYFKKIHIRDTSKVIILVCVSFLLVTFEDEFASVIPFASLIAVMTMGIALQQKRKNVAKRLSAKFNKLWVGAEVMLFVLVGATVDIRYAVSAGVVSIVLIFAVLVFRMLGVFLCLLKTKLTMKERMFCVIAYMPKATVQAAIGGVPLAMGLSCGNIVLTVAVTAILITAPLGAFLIEATYKKWLGLDAREFGLPQARERVFTVSVLNGERFEFDDLIRTPMRNLQEFLEDDASVPDVYDVTQPSVLACIGEKGIRRATVITDCAYTITTRQDRTPAQVIDRGGGRYRYLTERECWRLMGYTDEDFDRAKAVQERNGKYYKALYDQAGNSIAVPIFESIFRKIILHEVA